MCVREQQRQKMSRRQCKLDAYNFLSDVTFDVELFTVDFMELLSSAILVLLPFPLYLI